MRNDIILFDYGGVVAKDHQDPAEKELMDIFNVDRKTINSLLSEKTEHGAAFREGKISEKEFWDTVYLLSKFKGKCSYTYSELSTLFAKTYEMNMNLLDIIQKIRERYIVGILTNIDYARSCYLVNQLNINIFFDSLTDTSSDLLPYPASPRADPDRCGRSDRMQRSACRSDDAGSAS